MATWTDPRIAHVDEDVWSSSWWNTEIRDSLLVLRNRLIYWVGTFHQDCDVQISPTTNEAVFQPFMVEAACTVSGIGYTVDSVGAQNSDFGIYADNGNGTATRLQHSGSAALAGTGYRRSTFTAVNLIPYALYWWAYAFSSGGSTQIRGGRNPLVAAFSRTVASAFPLPSPITLGNTPRTTAAALATPVD